MILAVEIDELEQEHAKQAEYLTQQIKELRENEEEKRTVPQGLSQLEESEITLKGSDGRLFQHNETIDLKSARHEDLEQ